MYYCLSGCCCYYYCSFCCCVILDIFELYWLFDISTVVCCFIYSWVFYFYLLLLLLLVLLIVLLSCWATTPRLSSLRVVFASLVGMCANTPWLFPTLLALVLSLLIVVADCRSYLLLCWLLLIVFLELDTDELGNELALLSMSYCSSLCSYLSMMLRLLRPLSDIGGVFVFCLFDIGMCCIYWKGW